tara:strand:+ start:24 stop:608 length:585 start_codon:yes stop_codon:yes gene_type:complete
MNTEQAIYEMLTESTGTNMCDSGGVSGRAWQRNQKKSLQDFKDEPTETIEDKETDYPFRTVSVFHHLVDSCTYLDEENKHLKEWINQDAYNWSDNPEGRCASSLEDIDNYMSETYELRTDCINTYNDECDLSQTLQFIRLGDIYDCNIIALSIHNGADVRGGYTDYKIFEIDEDFFYSWYEESDQIIERLELAS